MGIQSDASELLVLFYNKKTSGERTPEMHELLEITHWERSRTENAVEYLIARNFIQGAIKKMAGGSRIFIIREIRSEGIDVIENPKEFKRHFNHEINLGIYKFSWGVSEK